jgi:hypothetical protein
LIAPNTVGFPFLNGGRDDYSLDNVVDWVRDFTRHAHSHPDVDIPPLIRCVADPIAITLREGPRRFTDDSPDEEVLQAILERVIPVIAADREAKLRRLRFEFVPPGQSQLFMASATFVDKFKRYALLLGVPDITARRIFLERNGPLSANKRFYDILTSEVSTCADRCELEHRHTPQGQPIHAARTPAATAPRPPPSGPHTMGASAPYLEPEVLSPRDSLSSGSGSPPPVDPLQTATRFTEVHGTPTPPFPSFSFSYSGAVSPTPTTRNWKSLQFAVEIMMRIAARLDEAAAFAINMEHPRKQQGQSGSSEPATNLPQEGSGHARRHDRFRRPPRQQQQPDALAQRAPPSQPANGPRRQHDAPKLEKLTPELRADLASKGICLRCRAGKHTYEECPKTIEIRQRQPAAPSAPSQPAKPASGGHGAAAGAPGAGSQVQIARVFFLGNISVHGDRKHGVIGPQATTAVFLAGHVVPAVIDTGASVSVIRAETARRLRLRFSSCLPPQPLVLADGSTIVITSTVQIHHFRLTPSSPAREATFYVLPGEGETLIGHPDLQGHLIGLGNPMTIIPYGDVTQQDDGIEDNTIPLAAPSLPASASVQPTTQPLAHLGIGVRLPTSGIYSPFHPGSGNNPDGAAF